MVDCAAIPPILAAPPDAHKVEVVNVPAASLNDLPLELLLALTEATEVLANTAPLQRLACGTITDADLIIWYTHVWP